VAVGRLYGVLGLLALIFESGRAGRAVAFPGSETAARVVAEGGVVETATAALFLGTAVLAAWSRLSGRAGGPFPVALAVLAVAAALDEVGLAAGGLGLDVPTVLGVKVDGFHDALTILRNAVDMVPGPVTLLLPAALAIIAAAAMLAFRAVARRSAMVRAVVADPAMPLVGLSVAIGFIAQLLDIRYLRLGVAGPVLEECLELVGAAVLFAAALKLIQRRSSSVMATPEPGKDLNLTRP
jgi:hypothetical protein